MAELSREEVLEFSSEMFAHFEEERRYHSNKWAESWRLYNNDYDWSSKLDWQSKQPFPKLPMAVEVASSIVEKALQDVDIRNFYLMTPLRGHEDEIKKEFIQPHIDYALISNNFKVLFSDMVKSGFLNSIIALKTYWWEGEEEKYVFSENASVFESPVVLKPVMISKPIIELVDPLYLYLDPSGRDKLLINEIEVDWSDLDGDDAYDQDEVQDIYKEWVNSERAAEAGKRDGKEVKGPSFRKTVTLMEFWGDLWARDGSLVMKNAHWVTAQGNQYLLKKPEANRFWHQMPPIIYGSLFRKPFSVYHKAIAEDLIGLQKLLTELINLVVDGVMYSVVKGYEIDLSQVLDPEDIRRGIYPGTTIKKRGFMNQQAVREIVTGGVPNQALLMLQFLDREFQAGSGVTEFVAGLPTRRGRQTASEILTKTQESYKLLEHLARGLEQQHISNLIKQLHINAMQFGATSPSPAMQRYMPTDTWTKWINMTPRERLKHLWAEFEYEVTGISGFIGRSQELEKLQALIGMIMQFAPILQNLGKVPNIPYLVDRMVTLLGFSTSKIFLSAPPQPPSGIPEVTPPRATGEPTEPAGGGGIRSVQVAPTGRPPQVVGA